MQVVGLRQVQLPRRPLLLPRLQELEGILGARLPPHAEHGEPVQVLREC